MKKILASLLVSLISLSSPVYAERITLVDGSGNEIGTAGNPIKTSGSGGGSVSDTAYGTGWDGDTTAAPSKNAVYDQTEQIRTRIMQSIMNRHYDAVVTVSSTITAALAAITDNSAFKRYLVYVPDGTYTENVVPKSYIDVIGQSRTGTIVKNSGDDSPWSNVSTENFHTMWANMTLEADTSSNTYAIHFDQSSAGLNDNRPRVDGANGSSETIFYNMTLTAAHKAGLGFGIYGRQKLYLVDVTTTGGDGAGSIVCSGIFGHNATTTQTRPAGVYFINVTATAGCTNGSGLEYRNSGSAQPDWIQVVGGSYTGGGGTGVGLSLINTGAGAGESYYYIDPLTSGTVTVSAGTRLTHFPEIPVPVASDPYFPEYVNRVNLYGPSTIGTVTQTGSGLNDITIGGTFTGAYTASLRIKISSAATPDLFDWSVDGGTTWAATGVAITGSAQSLLETGITVTFAATTGHTLNDYWSSTLTPPTAYLDTPGGVYVGGVLFAHAFGTQNTGVGIGVFDNGDNTGRDNTAVGNHALDVNLTGSDNTGVGQNALFANTTGNENTGLGGTALDSNTTGSNNTAVGSAALTANTTASSNTAVGRNALDSATDGHSNTAIGTATASGITSGDQNVALGMGALLTNSTGDKNVGVGYYAGAYETGSNGFYVNNQDRTNTAGDTTKSLLYGTFNATAASQTLAINAGTVTTLGTFTSSATNDLGWVPVDGTDNTAGNSQCTSACVVGVLNATGTAVTGFVACSDATADSAICAGAS